MTSPSAPSTNVGTRRARKLAVLSWLMLAAFVVWTLIFIFLSDPILRFLGFAPTQPGETLYLEAWGPWLAVTFVWLAPVIAGLVLAAIAARRRAGGIAWWPLGIHTLLILVLTVPNVIERLVTL